VAKAVATARSERIPAAGAARLARCTAIRKVAQAPSLPSDAGIAHAVAGAHSGPIEPWAL